VERGHAPHAGSITGQKALQSDASGFEALHAYFLDRLVPVCAQLLDAAVDAGEIRPITGCRAGCR
jgi:hypothetical protein